MANKSDFEVSQHPIINSRVERDLTPPLFKTQDSNRNTEMQRKAQESLSKQREESSFKSSKAFLLSCHDIVYGNIESWHKEAQNTCLKCHSVVEEYLSIPLDSENDTREISFAISLQNFRIVLKKWSIATDLYQDALITANETLEKIASGIPSLVKRLPFYIGD
jgi:hypothetical protein